MKGKIIPASLYMVNDIVISEYLIFVENNTSVTHHQRAYKLMLNLLTVVYPDALHFKISYLCTYRDSNFTSKLALSAIAEASFLLSTAWSTSKHVGVVLCCCCFLFCDIFYAPLFSLE